MIGVVSVLHNVSPSLSKIIVGNRTGLGGSILIIDKL